MRYAIDEPLAAPSELTSTTRTMLNRPIEARKPASGTMISLGIGVKMPSMNIARKMPR